MKQQKRYQQFNARQKQGRLSAITVESRDTSSATVVFESRKKGRVNWSCVAESKDEQSCIERQLGQ